MLATACTSGWHIGGYMRVEGKGGNESPHSEVRAIGNGGPSIWEVEHGAKGEKGVTHRKTSVGIPTRVTQ